MRPPNNFGNMDTPKGNLGDAMRNLTQRADIGDDEPEPDNVSTILGGVDDLLNLDDVQLSGPLVTLQENPEVLDPYSDNTYDFINNPIPLVAPPRSIM